MCPFAACLTNAVSATFAHWRCGVGGGPQPCPLRLARVVRGGPRPGPTRASSGSPIIFADPDGQLDG
jgi:hypothetical protein